MMLVERFQESHRYQCHNAVLRLRRSPDDGGVSRRRLKYSAECGVNKAKEYG
jgi:hypothetical protein